MGKIKNKIINTINLILYRVYDYLADFFDALAENKFQNKYVMYTEITKKLSKKEIQALEYAAKKEENYELLLFLKKKKYI